MNMRRKCPLCKKRKDADEFLPRTTASVSPSYGIIHTVTWEFDVACCLDCQYGMLKAIIDDRLKNG
jgi:hypothetical protein